MTAISDSSHEFTKLISSYQLVRNNWAIVLVTVTLLAGKHKKPRRVCNV